MALTVFIKAEHREPDPDLSLTLDAPRVVIGRSKSCEIQLPDPSVSPRHASIRREGGRTLIMDEGSTNGTLVEGVKLPPHTSRPVSDGELVRVGRVWLEIRLSTVAVAPLGPASPAQRARAVALAYLTRQLEAEGDPTVPYVEVLEGPDKGTQLQLDPSDREYVIGRSRDADLVLTDELVSRRHVTLLGDGVDWWLRDQRSKRGSALGGEPLVEEPVRWTEDEPLAIGDTTLALHAPIAEAFEQALAVPDATMRPDEFKALPPGVKPPEDSSPDGEDLEVPKAVPSASEDMPHPRERLALDEPEQDEHEGTEPTGLGYASIDVFVVLLALGLFGLSMVALMWVLG